MGAGPQDRGRRGDGTAAADRGADADQQSCLAVHLEIPAQQEAQAHDQGQADGCVTQPVQADPDHGAQIHLGAQAHHGQGQQAVRPGAGLNLNGVSEQQRDGRTGDQGGGR